jgi:radical SAM superfamily enzyme YgiQ (UPF0313 family)
MKVVLLNSSFVSQRKDHMQITAPHLRSGVASMAAFLREKGTEVAVMDPQPEGLSLQQLSDRIVSFSPTHLGLSSYTEEINDAASIAEEVKKRNPEIVTIVGGCHASAIPRETLEEFDAFDVCVFGEGELTLSDIVQGKNLADINGVVYRDREGNIRVNPPREVIMPLDKLPFPAWDLYDLKKYGNSLPVTALRGCPFSCSFCFRSTGRSIRYKSPERIIEEIKWNMEKFGVSEFTFYSGGTFPLDKTHALEVCNGIISIGSPIKWRASTRVNIVDEELLIVMKKSGCYELSLGIESGDREILKQCGKGTTPEEAERALKLCKKLGIHSELNFILGLPHETKETISATRKFALRMRRYAGRTNFAILTPFPGTKIYEWALNNSEGMKLMSKDWSDYCKQSGMTLKHENFEPGELVKYQSRLYLAYYLRSPIQLLKVFSFQRAIQLMKRLVMR